jgi:type IV fimbrial biogenesis protein FimT
MRTDRGHTLLEVLLVMTVAGSLLTLAVPAYASLLTDQRLTAAANALVASAQHARSVAITERVPATLCARGEAGRCGADYARGWLVFRDRDGDGRRDAGESVIDEVAVSGLRASSNRRVFTWRPFGRRSTNGTLTVCDPDGERPARAVVVNHIGRPRVTRAGVGGAALAC